MSQSSQQDTTVQLKRVSIVFSLAWTVIVLMGVGWHLFEGYHNTLESASIQAAQAFEKDLVYRSWAASHGGS